MWDQLNVIITKSAEQRGVVMPRIGGGHAGFSGGVFSLSQDPGSNVHTLGSSAVVSGFVDIENDDLTAK